MSKKIHQHRRRAHAWPQPWATLACAGIIFLWYMYTPLSGKIRGLLGATLFSCMEFCFYMMTHERPDGTIDFRPFQWNRPGHTTIHQWVINVFFLPFFLDYYFLWVQPGIVRALGWMVNVWVLEIVEGYFLIWLYGYNPAWEYHGKDALFHGTIKLSYWRFWGPMGFVLEYVAWPWLYPLTNTLAMTLHAFLSSFL